MGRARLVAQHSALFLLVAALTGVTACTEGSDERPRSAPSTVEPEVSVTAPEDEDNLEALLRDAVEGPVDGGRTEGMVALVRRDQELLVVESGVADTRTGEALTDGHRYVASSVTQPVVTTVVLQLMAEGELQPSDSVEAHLPGLLDRGSEITLVQLLTQSSGLAPEFDIRGLDRLIAQRPARPQLLVERVDALGPAFAPGTDAGYSGANALVLGLVVEQVTQRSLSRVLEQRVFAPAGMRDSSLGWEDESSAPVAHGYADGGDVTRSPEVDWAWAAGGVVSTHRDVLRFHEALLEGDLLPARWLTKMTTPYSDEVFQGWDYGYGLAHLELRCGRAFGDNGALPGYLSEAWTLEGGDRAVAVLANTFDSDSVSGETGRVVEHALCS